MRVLLLVRQRVNGLGTALAAMTLLAVGALLLTEVAMRALSNPVLGAQELSEMGMIIVVFGALAQLEAEDGQIRVDLLARTPGGLSDRVMRGGTSGLTVLLWGALAVALFQSARLSGLLGLKSNLIGLPRAPFQLALAGFAAMGALAAFVRIWVKPEISHD